MEGLAEKNLNKTKNKILNLWKACSDEFPEHVKQFNQSEKKQNEKWIHEKIEDGFSRISPFIAREKMYKKEEANRCWKQSNISWIEELFHTPSIFGIDALPQEFKKNMLNQSKYFYKKTREYDHAMDLESIMQAYRNYCLSIILAKIGGEEHIEYDAIWAYSLLYPYTDNYIDSEEVTACEKKAFNVKLYKRLLGESVNPDNDREEKVFTLINIIESIFPRETYPMVYKNLLWIFDAQVKSLQQNQRKSLSEEELLEISIYKGGASVLADGFLLNGNILPEKWGFYIGFGYFLQLMDDLQDLKEDGEKDHQTLLGLWYNRGNLKENLNKVLQFLQKLMEKESHSTEKELENLVLFYSNILFYLSAWKNRNFLEYDYSKKLENYVPVSFLFLEETELDIQQRKKDFIASAEGNNGKDFLNNKKQNPDEILLKQLDEWIQEMPEG